MKPYAGAQRAGRVQTVRRISDASQVVAAGHNADSPSECRERLAICAAVAA
jgi:hypothetical protein